MTDGERDRIYEIINDLAPATRRDEWWASDGPYEILARHINTGMVVVGYSAVHGVNKPIYQQLEQTIRPTSPYYANNGMECGTGWAGVQPK